MRYLNYRYNIMEKVPTPVFYMIPALILVIVTRRLLRYLAQRKELGTRIAKKLQKVQENHGRLELHIRTHTLVNPNWEDIVRLSFNQLLQQLHDGQLSCLEVLHAYQAKALEVTRTINCVTEFITEAEEWAKKLDDDHRNGKRKGPLHGLPFSVKDNVSIVGYDSTAGISKYLHQPVTEDAAMISALKNLGAIPFCKTNIPQTMLSFGCSNPIWGLTKNPHDKDRTPGGSSGGEGALVAAGGSLLGIGSDIGGSARFPAAFCGIPSIKPTFMRMSYKGFRKSAVGCVGLNAVPGILARDSETVVTLTKLLLENGYLHEKFDPDILPIHWNDEKFNSTKKLRIGYYEDDGFLPTTPGVRRAVQLARRCLEELGHELVPFVPPRVEDVVNSVVNILGADQGKYLLEALAVDDIDPVLKITMLGLRIPYFLKVLLKPIVSLVAPRLVCCFMAGGGHRLRHTHQLWGEIVKQSEYKSEFLGQWRELGLDLCIAPCFACPAPLSKDVGRLVPAFSYGCLYNFLDLPVATVPITRENEDDQAQLEDYHFNDLVCHLVKKTTRGAVGMPISVQIVGLPYQEEIVLRGMRILDSAIQS